MMLGFIRARGLGGLHGDLGRLGQVLGTLDAVLFEALGRNASDIHIQPLAEQALIRVRVDGAALS